jgi:hypothetical protein
MHQPIEPHKVIATLYLVRFALLDGGEPLVDSATGEQVEVSSLVTCYCDLKTFAHILEEDYVNMARVRYMNQVPLPCGHWQHEVFPDANDTL